MNWFKHILFSEIVPVIKIGRKRALTSDDMPPIDDHLKALSVEQAYASLSTTRAMRFVWDAFWAAGFSARRAVFIDVIRMPLGLSGPIIMRELLQNIAVLQAQPTLLNTSLILAFLLSLLVIVDGVVVQHFYYNALLTWGRIANGLNMRVYRHALGIKRSAQLKTQTGDMVNHMASDSEGMAEAAFFIPEILQALLLIVGAMVLLYTLLGTAALAALLTLLLTLPLTRRAALRFAHIDAELWKHRDERVTLMSQVLSGIRVIKYFAWERSISSEVDDLRAKEIDSYVKLVRAEALGVMLFLSTTTLVAFVGFGTYVLLGGTLSASLIFPCLLLFMQLENPIGALPHFIKNLAHARVAADRLNQFFHLSTHDEDLRPESAALKTFGCSLVNLSVEVTTSAFQPPSPVSVQDSAPTSTEQCRHILKNIDVHIAQGESVAIVGAVGSGKTSLLLSILGEVDIASGHVSFHGIEPTELPRIAYVSQEAFVLNASLRENILFGESLSSSSEGSLESLLNTAIDVCVLQEDLAQLSAGLETEIGERGVNLSGGQKMRVTMARAVMKQAGLILMDDPLAAVDVHTEELLINRLIFGEWKDRTRLISTHRLAHLHRFDKVLFLQEGEIAAMGTLDEVLQQSRAFKEFFAEHSSAAEIAQSMTIQQSKKDVSVMDANDGRLVDDEDKMTGSIKAALFFSYLRSLGKANGGKPLWVYTTLTLSCLLVVILPMIQNAWLAWWSDSVRQGYVAFEWMQSALRAVAVYGIIGICVLLANFMERLVWMLRATMAGRDIHNETLAAVLAAPLRFFDSTPMGRILNRFAHDLAGVDDELSWNFESTFRSFTQMLGTLLLIVITVPFVLVAAVPALFIFYRIQRDYRRCAREAKRLSSISRSPRYAHFKETITGLSVIRAYKQQAEFTQRFVDKLEFFQRMNWGSIMLNRWFSSRAPVLSGVIALSTTMTIVVLCSQGQLSSGIAGVVITYALTFWANLNWCVRSFSEVESRMTSYERLRSYAQLEPEPHTTTKPELSPDQAWPRAGSIDFDNVSARYADNLPLVLRELSFKIKGGSRVGIVGRTGSGKTTIFQTLFRFIELASGSIEIDGVNIACIPHERLRRSMAVIPQDPMLFIGNVRSNLDRYHEYSDEAVWSAIERVQMQEALLELGGLNAQVSESGLNFSQGQRQLLCLARALLTQARIIVMDEATASVDVQTDALIQHAIRDEFKNVTVLIIAHRLNSVADADVIIEMQKGRCILHQSASDISENEIM